MPPGGFSPEGSAAIVGEPPCPPPRPKPPQPPRPPPSRAWFERLEEVGAAGQHVAGHLLQRGDVVHDVEAAPVGGGDEVTVLERQVPHRHQGQVQRQRLPRASVVEGEVHRALGPHHQQTSLARILAQHPRRLVVGEVGLDLLPVLAEVRGLPQVRVVVVQLDAVGCHVGHPVGVGAGIDAGDLRELLQPLGRDVVPGVPAVPGQVDLAVVGARPQLAGLAWATRR